MAKDYQQKTAQQTGMPINSHQNYYTNLDTEENKEGTTSNGRTPPQGIQTGQESKQNQHAKGNQNKNKEVTKDTCIDFMLPIPTNPNVMSHSIINVEVEGGMEGGCQENHLQEGVTKVGNLTHVLHEVFHIEHSSDLRALATPKAQQSSPRQANEHQHEQTEVVNAEKKPKKIKGHNNQKKSASEDKINRQANR